MGGHRMGRPLAQALLMALVLLGAMPAAALTPSETGWWWRAQAGLVLEVPPPPQVPDGGLYVEGAPDGPTAVSALRFGLAPGHRPDRLMLRVAAEQGGEDAVLWLCPAAGSWLRADAGRWENRPVAECPGQPWVGTRAADGASWSFDLTALPARDRRLDVVLLPGLVEGRPEQAAGSVFSLAFEPPGPDTLTTRVSGDDGGPPVGPPYQPPQFTPTFGQPPPEVGQPPPAAPPAPQVQDPSVIAPKITPGPPRRDAAAARDGKDARALATLIALLSVGVAGVLSRDRAVSLSAGKAEGDERVGGIGRFRRTRDEPPPPL